MICQSYVERPFCRRTTYGVGSGAGVSVLCIQSTNIGPRLAILTQGVEVGVDASFVVAIILSLRLEVCSLLVACSRAQIGTVVFEGYWLDIAHLTRSVGARSVDTIRKCLQRVPGGCDRASCFAVAIAACDLYLEATAPLTFVGSCSDSLDHAVE